MVDFTKRSDVVHQHKIGTVPTIRVENGSPESHLDTETAYDPTRFLAYLNNSNPIMPHYPVTHTHVLLYHTNYTFKKEHKPRRALILPIDKVTSTGEDLTRRETGEDI